MPDDEKKQILDKIKKLLSFDEDNATEGDLQAAAAAVKRLLAKYQLSMQDVKNHCDEVVYESEGIVEIGAEKKWGAIPQWYRYLAGQIALGFDCALVSTRRVHPDVLKWARNLSFVGLESDAQAAAFLFETVVRELTRLAEDGAENYILNKKGKQRYKKSFICGAADAIRIRLQREAEAIQSETGTNLVPIKKDRIEVWMKQKEVKKTNRKAVAIQEYAAQDGFIAGQTIPLIRGLEDEEEPTKTLAG